MRSALFLIACLFPAGAAVAAEGESVPVPGIDAKVFQAFDKNQVRLVTEFHKALPAGCQVQAEVRFTYSDDEGKQVPHILSLTPLNAEGKPDGEARYYGDNHQMIRTVPYVQGKKQGVEKKLKHEYDQDARAWKTVVLAEIPWEDDAVHGIKKLFHATNGKVKMEVPYDKGEQNGIAKEYDLPGRLAKETPYIKGKVDGEMVEYFPATGQKRRVVPYRAGVVHGVVHEYYDNGKLKKEVPVKEERFHGIEKQYDEEGGLIKTRYWLDDDEVSREAYEKAGGK